MKKNMQLLFLIFLPALAILMQGQSARELSVLNKESTISDALVQLGEELPEHARPKADSATLKRGYELITLGRTIGPDGKRSKYISKYYVCTSCHNLEQENPDLSKIDPQARLEYANQKGQKFLPGSGFFGIANRETWYNGDYEKKYGKLVEKARNSLAEATQLCATVCSSGRLLEEWELEAILAYYWQNQIKLKDLELSKQEWEQLILAENKKMAVDLLKSKYVQSSPATFGQTPANFLNGYEGIEGDFENGRRVWELSCMSCHQTDGVSTATFDNSKLTFKKFMRHLNQDHPYNLYKISRYGTSAEKGKPRYMPLYPLERLSDKQLEDLRVFFEQKSES